MSTTSKDRTKKSRQNKKLKELNSNLKANDLLRGEKQTSKRDEVLLRENLRLKTNEPKTRFKSYISKLIRHHFQDAGNCFFFSLCYPYKDNTGMVANISIMETLKVHLLNIDAVESMIIIPEYHRTRSAIHNHGIIRVNENFSGDVKEELRKIWVEFYRGSVFVTPLNASKRFETYLTKFVEADDSRLYNFSDGLVTVGIDFNSVVELRVNKPSLISIKPYTRVDENEELKSNNSIAGEKIVVTVLTSEPTTTNDNPALTEIIASEPNRTLPLHPGRAISPNQVLLNFSRWFSRGDEKRLTKGIEISKRAIAKVYRWYSILIVAYIHFIMRI